MRPTPVLLALFGILGLEAAGATCPAREAPVQVCTERRWPETRFDLPVWVGVPPGAPGTRLVVEQRGVVRALDAATGATRVWADLRDRVNREGNEEGLLALAFHPRFAQGERRVFVWYTAARPRRTILASFRVAGEGVGALDPSTERRLLEVAQPWANHNGGDLHFGPDGLLHVSIGDGGSANDPRGNGQDPTTLLGTIVRIDVDRSEGGRPYGIPADNPYADGEGGRPEIYTIGLRNPWRMAFDDAGRLWVGDVGQNAWEEVTVVSGPGENHGWNIREGESCFRALTCRSEGLVAPVHTYPHKVGRSITGGVPYTGDDLPGLANSYLFADYVTGRVWSICMDEPGTGHRELADLEILPSTFGVEPDGEVLLADWRGGGLHRLVPCGR
jgi:glucose/arabinose dehydrogenase